MDCKFKRTRTKIQTKKRGEYPELEIALMKKFEELRARNACISGKRIKILALEMHSSLYINNQDKQSFQVCLYYFFKS